MLTVWISESNKKALDNQLIIRSFFGKEVRSAAVQAEKSEQTSGCPFA